ncbi:MAG: hypothetical protein IJI59_06240, partial [Clostridia bacterium]|nr:hypothetical protein [Clostridia bacterium]
MADIVFGAFDPLYPNGLLSCVEGDNIFGLRVVTRDDETGALAEGRSLDMTTLRIGPMDGDRYFSVGWANAGKQARFVWSRLDERNVYGRLEMDQGLSALIELYVPREYRMKYRWVNFTRQAARTFTGELIAPFGQPPMPAMRLLLSRPPEAALGYNRRAEQLETFSQTGALPNLTRGDIWNDMGVSWLYGVKYTGSITFLYTVGEAEDFLALPGDEAIDAILSDGEERMQARRPAPGRGLT